MTCLGKNLRQIQARLHYASVVGAQAVACRVQDESRVKAGPQRFGHNPVWPRQILPTFETTAGNHVRIIIHLSTSDDSIVKQRCLVQMR